MYKRFFHHFYLFLFLQNQVQNFYSIKAELEPSNIQVLTRQSNALECAEGMQPVGDCLFDSHIL